MQDTQEHRGHVAHLALNDVEPSAHPHEPLSSLAGLLALGKENCLHSMDKIAPAMHG